MGDQGVWGVGGHWRQQDCSKNAGPARYVQGIRVPEALPATRAGLSAADYWQVL